MVHKIPNYQFNIIIKIAKLNNQSDRIFTPASLNHLSCELIDGINPIK